MFYTSGRTSNEAAFLYQLFVREFGTNNLPDCSNMCHESSGVALGEALGLGKGSVTLEDFDHAQLIVVVGPEPRHQPPADALRAAAGRAARGDASSASTRSPRPGSSGSSIRSASLDLLGKGTQLASLWLAGADQRRRAAVPRGGEDAARAR